MLVCVGAQLWYFTLGQVLFISDSSNKQVKVPFSRVYTLTDIGKNAEKDFRKKTNGRNVDSSILYKIKWEAIYREAIKSCNDKKEAIELTNKCLSR